jgi:hypothetical protein
VRAGEHAADQAGHAAALPGRLYFYGLCHVGPSRLPKVPKLGTNTGRRASYAG